MRCVQRILLLTFAVTGFARTDCKRTNQDRNVKLDICNECKELLTETIAPAFIDLKRFSEWLENKTDTPPNMNNLELNIKVTEEEMLGELPVFIHQLNLLQQAWGVHNLPEYSHNLDKHLRRIFCFIKGSSKRKQGCISKQGTEGQEPGQKHTGDYIRKVYSTLHGFVKSL